MKKPGILYAFGVLILFFLWLVQCTPLILRDACLDGGGRWVASKNWTPGKCVGLRARG